jgi:hypothetical protein
MSSGWAAPSGITRRSAAGHRPSRNKPAGTNAGSSQCSGTAAGPGSGCGGQVCGHAQRPSPGHGPGQGHGLAGRCPADRKPAARASCAASATHQGDVATGLVSRAARRQASRDSAASIGRSGAVTRVRLAQRPWPGSRLMAAAADPPSSRARYSAACRPRWPPPFSMTTRARRPSARSKARSTPATGTTLAVPAEPAGSASSTVRAASWS